MPFILAHGSRGTGYTDEILMVVIALVFTGLLLYSWYKSRSMEPPGSRHNDLTAEESESGN